MVERASARYIEQGWCKGATTDGKFPDRNWIHENTYRIAPSIDIVEFAIARI
jgi:hypothetical protein